MTFLKYLQLVQEPQLEIRKIYLKYFVNPQIFMEETISKKMERYKNKYQEKTYQNE